MNTPTDTQHRCECGEPITDFIWVVRGVYLCSQRCGERADNRDPFRRDDRRPQSQACFARM